MPTFDSPVNPLHQVQGLGPVIIKVNELSVTTSILTQVFQLDLFAEYLPHEDAKQPIQVFRIGRVVLVVKSTYLKAMKIFK